MPAIHALLVALAVAAPESVEIPAALLRFDLDRDFVGSKSPDPPAIWSGVLRVADQTVARLDVAVIPVEADAAQAEVIARAEELASIFLPRGLELDLGAVGRDGLFATFTGTLDTTAADVMVVEADERRLVLVFAGRRDVMRDRAAEFATSARSIKASDAPWPTEPGARVVDATRGFALSVPARFVASLIDDAAAGGGARGFETPAHLGLGVTFDLVFATEDLDRPLADAAKRAFGADADLVELDIGPFRAVAATPLARGKHRVASWLVEISRRRLLVEAAAPASRFDAFAPAFSAAIASLGEIERRPDVDLASRYSDSEHGFSIRPPIRLSRRASASNDPAFAGAFAVFVDPEIAPPATALVVRAADCDGGDAMAAAARLVADAASRGLSIAIAPERRLLNRKPAACFATSGAGVVEYRTIVAAEHGAFELAFTCVAEELLAERPTFDAAALSFQVAAKVVLPELDDAATTGKIRYRAPSGWSRSDPAPAGRVTFVESGRREARVEFGESPTPKKAALGGAAESYRAALVLELEAEGNQKVRVEESRVEEKRGRTAFWYRVAYVAEGRPVRELRFALPGADGIAFARAVCPAARFAELLDLFEATIWSLEWNDSGH